MNLQSHTLRPPGDFLGLVGILVLGLAVRLAIAPLGAHPGDLPVLMRWAEAMRAHGWLNIYLASDANYPPLGMALIGLSQFLVDSLAPGAPIGGSAWLVFVKLPAILADLLVIALVARASPVGQKVSDWLLLSLALNPALLLMSAWWAQLDSVYAALALAALAGALRDRPFWSGAALAAAALVKLQGLVIAPLVILVIATCAGGTFHTGPHSFRVTKHFLRLIGGVMLPTALGLLPFVLAGQGRLLRLRLTAVVASPNWLTINALNPWYLLTAGAGNWTFNAPLAFPDSASVVAGLSARTVGGLLLFAWTLCVLLLAWRRMRGALLWSGQAAPLAGALLYLGVFLWPTQSHERYALAAIPLLAAAGAWAAGSNESEGKVTASPGLIWNVYTLYGMITIAMLLNLLWAAAPFPWLGEFAGDRAAGMGIAALLTFGAGWSLAALWRKHPGEHNNSRRER